MNARNLSELIETIRNYSTREPPYDLRGVMQLFMAALDSLRTNVIQGDFDDLPEYLDDGQVAYLQDLVKSCLNRRRGG